MLPTPSPSLILSWSVTPVYSRQDSLTMAAPPTSIQGIPSYGPTPTPGRLLEGNKVCLPIVLLLLGGCQISTVTSSCMYESQLEEWVISTNEKTLPTLI